MWKNSWQIGSGRGVPGSRLYIAVLLIGLALVCIQCTGSSGGSGGGGFFDVLNFSATKQSPRVFLNDAIEILFSDSVDPKTVFSGIYIYPSASAGAKRARGEFKVEGNKVIFTPQLPTDPNFTNGGFMPDTEYTICVPMANDSCSVFIQNSPGVRSTGGRGVTNTRVENFLTVKVSGGTTAFRPELAPQRPEIVKVEVHDANGVEQALNPITNLISGWTWQSGILSTITATPATTVIPGTNQVVPRYQYVPTMLTKKVTSSINLTANVVSKSPLAVTVSNPSQPIAMNDFQDKGGVLTIRDSSTPPVTASWAIDYNTPSQIVTLANSGPNIDKVAFQTPPYTMEISQGITRQVAPGDINTGSEVKITFSEALNPLASTLDNFVMYRVSDSPGGLQYAVVPPGSTLQSSSRQGLSHDIVDGKSVVTLRPKTSFPQSKPNEPATIVVIMKTAQDENSVPPVSKNSFLRDLNNYPLAYPVKTGWILNLDARKNATTVAYIQSLPYLNAKPWPENIQVAWAFQTRADAEVLNAVVETFADQQGLSTEPGCQTTAAWTKAQAAGLYGTYGYGGNGELGDVVVQAILTIDSDTMTPDANGIVNVNYNKLTVASSATLTLKGKYPIRINALDSMIIEGTVDASGRAGNPGVAGKATVVGRIVGGRGGPGAGAGGDSNPFPNNPIGALPMELRGGPGYPKASVCGDINKSDNRLITVVEPNCGGGTGGNRGLPSGTVLRSGCSGNGGGHMTSGVQTDYLCSNIGAYGREPCVNWIVATGATGVQYPTAGTGGGAGGNAAIATGNPSPKDDIVAGSGGGAGGGVELQCAGTLSVKSSANIIADGANGAAGFSTVAGSPPSTIIGGWGAGGSGGSIWLTGTSVTVESGSTVSAVGGKGNPNPPTPSRTGDGGNGYIIIRDRGNSPTIQSGANVTPGNVQSREDFDPANNGLSEAFSVWYDSGEANPQWRFDANDPHTGFVVPGKDLSWLNAPATGQTVKISFQGAPDDNGAPNSNPATWIPAGNTTKNPCAVWDTNISNLLKVGNLRHIRFRVEFDLGKRDKGSPAPNQISINRIVINYAKP